MSEPSFERPAHGETIAPLERPERAETLRLRDRPRSFAQRRWLPALGLAALVLAVIVVFGFLPRWTAERAAETEPARAPQPAPAPSEPTLSPEQIEALKAQGESLLAELLPQQPRVEALKPSDWAPEDWKRYQGLGRNGDDAYLAHDYRAAVDDYGSAVELGKALLTRAADLTRDALAAGEAALAAGRPDEAAERFNFVLGIEPDHEQARAGLARAKRLPEVLATLEQADALAGHDHLAEAIELYRKAAALDPDYAPASTALARAASRLEDERFERHMSDGYAALDDQRFDEAHTAFKAALALKPGAQAARDGIDEAEQGQSLDAIALAEARALAFERRELWNRAIEQYRAALATDDTLDFAREGLARAEARADLDAKLSNLIEHPDLLFRDNILEQARALLEQAHGESAQGPRLESQTQELTRLVALASEPQNVKLQSDEKTEVTLYRVGTLGTFAEKEVQLRPGTYTVVGSRDGYRDVRRTFTVLPGHELDPVVVECVEPI